MADEKKSGGWGTALLWLGTGLVAGGGLTLGGMILFDWVRTSGERDAAVEEAKAEKDAK